MDLVKKQVYYAIEKWSTRLNKWEYSKQIKANKNQKLKTFSPNAFSLQLLEARRNMLDGIATPDDVMGLLHTVEGKTECRLCIDAGL